MDLPECLIDRYLKDKSLSTNDRDFIRDRYLEIRQIPEGFNRFWESDRDYHLGAVRRHTCANDPSYPVLIGTRVRHADAFLVEPEDTRYLRQKGYYFVFSSVPRQDYVRQTLREDLSGQQKYDLRMRHFLETHGDRD